MHVKPTTADACVRQTIRDCLSGTTIKGTKDNSLEVMYYQTGMSNPLARIMTSQHRPLNIVTALARFTWLIAGNNRMEDIAYYEPKVNTFTDDGLSIPGSDYGMRIMQPRPGLNQLQGVVDRLKQDPSSRQAAVVVWQPEDAVRESRDIPCTFGLFFHIRKSDAGFNELNMCVNMRSNNAFRILPFNLFEFSMLHELVAASLNVRLGDYVHWAASMHVYNNEREWQPTCNIAMDELSDSIQMEQMGIRGPGQWRPLTQAYILAKLEARLRHACTESDLDDIESESYELNQYWQGLYRILECWTRTLHGLDPHYEQVPDYLRDLTNANCLKAQIVRKA